MTPNNSYWNQAGAWYQIYYYGSSGNGWLTLNQGPESDVYFATIPAGKTYTGIIFLRMKPGAHAKTWDYESTEIWNKIEVTTNSDSKNNYKITGWSSGQWIDHEYVKKGIKIFFDNTKTNWGEVWLTVVGTLDVNKCNDGNYVYSYYNQSATIDNYKTYADSWYKMKKYCGNIYYLELPEDSYRSYFSFADKDMFGYNEGKVYASSVVLHFKWDESNPCITPTVRKDFNESCQSYEWEGYLKALPDKSDMNADPLSTLKVTPSQANPVVRGSEVKLSVENDSQTWKWYSSTNGKRLDGMHLFSIGDEKKRSYGNT